MWDFYDQEEPGFAEVTMYLGNLQGPTLMCKLIFYVAMVNVWDTQAP